jgi:hypothetical protein
VHIPSFIGWVNEFFPLTPIAKSFQFEDAMNSALRFGVVNAFNHPSGRFGIEPFIEDAGLVQLGEGFANPKVQGDVPRDIRFGLKVTF